ncbi:unnamed protein product [Penicillium salamii]|uniref:Major facilitator superfamily (MFS) profile domain-containing protein n=1 Tax=Penicillium salamii TaxID=1612424 RepID=A0A9W4K5S2_9EURO|nr:unnamed protein product [Penicillium salamii]CAG8018389.1 unnamed protein product [Penicillium salamii]CAG8126013.1 unnamed protein product [Penicillium salamii]CAG8244305.1 unnamed protein product [Penicillium salamii]CAG8285117.1 unnamed protein product [Penicillium salamii]
MSHHEDRASEGSDTDVEKQDSNDNQVRSPGGTPRSTLQRKEGAGHDKSELKHWECYDKLGYSFPWWKKWGIISVIFAVQTSMNFNAGFYASSVSLYAKHFNITEQAARVGQMGFLVAYAFGCEFWAPFSEEFGRWPIMQLSLFFVNIWQIPCALAPNFGTIVICRILGGVSSAGGSVTLGMVADMWEPEDQQYAVAFIVLSSVAGSVIAPVVGGFVATFLSWRWNFWIQLILGGFVQILHFMIPETRCSILITKEAKRRRKNGDMVWSGDEITKTRMSFRWIFMVWIRPFIMFVREPIVLCLSLLSGFSDSLIFTFLQSYTPVYKQWHFSTITTGLAFLPLLVGYVMAYVSFIPWIHRHCRVREKDPDGLQPEARLYWLLYVAPLLSIGLFGFAWTSLGPPQVHWIAPMIFSALIAIANYAIYMATVDYMIASYGPWSASATGGNGFARDFLAGIAAMYSVPMYEHMGTKHHLEWPSTFLAFMAIVFTIPIYVFYWKGPRIREMSPFAQTVAADRKAAGRRVSQCGSGDPDPVERYLSRSSNEVCTRPHV